MKFVLGVCGDLLDFSLPSAVTADNFNYVDWSHFIHDVSFLALAKVLGGSAQGLDHHPEFGQRLYGRDSDRYAGLLDKVMSAQQQSRRRCGRNKRQAHGAASD